MDVHTHASLDPSSTLTNSLLPADAKTLSPLVPFPGAPPFVTCNITHYIHHRQDLMYVHAFAM